MSSFAEEMAEFDEEWETNAAEPRRQVGMLKDGRHQVIIDEARVEKVNDRWVWNVKFQNKEGTIRKFGNLDHEVGRDIAAKDAKILGYTGKMSALEEACQSGFFIDLVVEIGVRRKQGTEREFIDIFVNRCLGKGNPEEYKPTSDAESGATAGVGEGVDDDIPF